MALEPLLEQDPSGAYAAMDAATRERYRRRCQELAERSGEAPLTVAREALRLSEACAPEDARGRHVGVWLVAEGQPQLEARLGISPSRPERVRRFLRENAGNAYLGALGVLLLPVLVGLERLLAAGGVGALARLGLLALLAPSLVEFLQSRLDPLLLRLAGPPVPLPRLEPERIFTPGTRTLAVTPLLIGNAQDVDSQLRMMEVNFLGNDAPELFFALLTDFRDAPVQEEPAERALLERLESGLRELNARHGHTGRPRFFQLHRERRWNPVAGRWMGWERKRGKLDELNRLLLGARDTSYTTPLPDALRGVRYVITLDADTHLVPGSAARLVATLHHPLNQARFDAAGERVVAGYSLLQPTCEFAPTRDFWLRSGGWPVSLLRDKKPPRFDVVAMHQAVFGTGEFFGKGLYDVAAFHRALAGRIPENTVLSHDRLEGLYARVALVHDIKMFEGRPGTYSVLARIWHRWMRGDWQVLPWVLPRVPMPGGGRAANPLSVFDRWRLLAPALRLLLQPLTVLALLGGWLWLPGHLSAVWSLTLAAWMNRQSICDMLLHTPRLMRDAGSVGRALRYIPLTAVGLVAGTVLAAGALLPITALTIDALLRAQYRLTVDRTHILDWTTHAHSGRKRGLFSRFVLPEVGGATLLALLLGGVLLAVHPSALPGASPLLLGWIPFLLVAMRERPPPRALALPAGERERLLALARDAWTHYTRVEEPAREATPTDLALELTASLGAHHLGQLTLEACAARLDTALTWLEGLERHRGHPRVGARHIVTAESGVLAAALVVVESALRTAREAPAQVPSARLEALESRARRLREEMDFTLLYDAARRCFHEDYDVETRVAGAEHAGALTSGAVLAGFVAIASRQIPLEHWLTLVNSAPRPGHDEPLLPTVFLCFPRGTLLSAAAEAAVGNTFAATPHALLAMRFQPRPALAALRHAARPTSRRAQALTVAAVANLACDDILLQHFHQHWRTAWVEALIFETKDAP